MMRTAIFLVSLLSVSCGPSIVEIQAKGALGARKVINEATDAAEQEYQHRQVKAIEDACGSTEPADVTAPCQAQARTAADAVRSSWAPVWSAQESLRQAHQLWVESILVAASGDVQDVRSWIPVIVETLDSYDAFAGALQNLGVDAPPLPDWTLQALRFVGGDR